MEAVKKKQRFGEEQRVKIKYNQQDLYREPTNIYELKIKTLIVVDFPTLVGNQNGKVNVAVVPRN